MQLTSTTDYAIRIISYLTEKNGSASANELSDELNIPNSQRVHKINYIIISRHKGCITDCCYLVSISRINHLQNITCC